MIAVWGMVTDLWGDLRTVCLGFCFDFFRWWLMLVLMLAECDASSFSDLW